MDFCPFHVSWREWGKMTKYSKTDGRWNDRMRECTFFRVIMIHKEYLLMPSVCIVREGI